LIKVTGQIIGISVYEQKGKKYQKLVLLDGPNLHEIKATYEKGMNYSVGELADIEVNVFSFRDKIYFSVK